MLHNKISIKTFDNPCKFSAGIFVTYPSPDISGTYLPHPKSGGRESANAYNQIVNISLIATEYVGMFPLIKPACKKLLNRQTDKTQRVIMDTNPTKKEISLSSLELSLCII